MQVFIYDNEKDFAKIFLFHFNKTCNIFLSTVFLELLLQSVV